MINLGSLEETVTIPTLVTFFDIYIDDNKTKNKNETVKEFMNNINQQINELLEVNYSEKENEKIRIELCCKTFNIDMPIYYSGEKILFFLKNQVEKILDEISEECGIKIKAKEVEISEYPQYYLNEKELKEFNDYFEEQEEQEEM